MEPVTLRAHFEGGQVVIDEPQYALAEGAELLITVLPTPPRPRRPWARVRPEQETEPLKGGAEPVRARQSSPRKTTGEPKLARQHGQGGGRGPERARQDNPGRDLSNAFDQTGAPAGERVVFRRVAVRDPEVNNIEGATLLLPDGWTLTGGFVWLPLFSIQANLLLRATDPATGANSEILPTQFYVWMTQMAAPLPPGTNYLGRVLVPPPRNLVEFVHRDYILQGPLRHLSAARLQGVEDLPERAAESARSQGGGVSVQVARLRYEYEIGSRRWAEEVYPTLSYLPSDGFLYMWSGQAITLRAPADELERLRPLLLVPLQSVRLTLDWSATLEHVRGLYNQNRAQQIHATRKLGQLQQQYHEELWRAHQQVFEDRMASLDRVAFSRREAVGGIETYVNPFDSHAVELPTGYAYNWVREDGTIIGINDPTFDPRPGDRSNWQLMQRFRP